MPSSSAHLDLVDLRRALGDLTQTEAAQLLQVIPNTWARWERGELRLPPARAHQVRRLQLLVNQYGEGPFWGLGIDGIRSVLDGLTVPEALQAHAVDAYGAPLPRYRAPNSSDSHLPAAHESRRHPWRVDTRVSPREGGDSQTQPNQTEDVRLATRNDLQRAISGDFQLAIHNCTV